MGDGRKAKVQRKLDLVRVGRSRASNRKQKHENSLILQVPNKY